jgi:prevent-host-death family protein
MYKTAYSRGVFREKPSLRGCFCKRPATGNPSASKIARAGVLYCMADQREAYGRPKVLPTVSTDDLRKNLSEWLNRAGFGYLPVVILRRERKVAALISIDDLAFLERMRERRDTARAQELPKDPEKIVDAVAERLKQELFFEHE